MLSIGAIEAIAVVTLGHCIMAFLTSMELKNSPFYSFKVKILWFILIWGMPVIGIVLFHKFSGVGWVKKDSPLGEGSSTGGQSDE